MKTSNKPLYLVFLSVVLVISVFVIKTSWFIMIGFFKILGFIGSIIAPAFQVDEDAAMSNDDSVKNPPSLKL